MLLRHETILQDCNYPTYSAIMAFVHCSSVAWMQGECRGYGSGHIAPVMIKKWVSEQQKYSNCSSQARFTCTVTWNWPMVTGRIHPHCWILSFLQRSSFPRYLDGGGGAISGQSFRCWKEDWSLSAPCAVRKRFYQRMVREFNLVASNCPRKQPVFPSPWEGGGMTGF